MFPKVGMRNIKTSTAVFVCLLIFRLINRENSIQACIAAVICMQNTIVDSYQKGLQRVIGTIIGGIAGGFVLFIVTTFGHENLLLFIIPLGMTILIELCVAIDMKQSVVICCVVYLGILISKPDDGYLLYTLNRVIDTIAGIMIALFVNKYMNMPDRLKELLNQKRNKEKQSEIDLSESDGAAALNGKAEFNCETSDEEVTSNVRNNE